MLETALRNFALDCDNSDLNYKLGIEYENIGQTAAAMSYLLRAAERTSNLLLRYECLIRIGNCFDRQQNRAYTVKSMYRLAISILPDRPEAYYMLAKYLAYEQNYSECYLFCDLALFHCKGKEYEDINVGYPGIWGIYYQYAVASWWHGKGMKCRRIIQSIVNNYWHKMDDYHKGVVEGILTNLGSGPENHSVRRYTKEHHNKLRFKFNGSEQIDYNYSQVYQDMFVLSMLNGKTNGRFLEVGGADPWKCNNTALLEQLFGWKGTSIDFNENFASSYKTSRPNITVYCTDALGLNYDDILAPLAVEGVVDYLQLDIEPPKSTYECLLKIPFDKYKFRVITYEHDYPADVTRQYREKSREYLRSKGYELIVNDVSPDGEWNFEDWWVHPDYVDKDIKEKMMSVTDKNTKIEDYFLSSTSIQLNSIHDTKNTILEAHKKYDNQLCWGWCSLDKSGCFVDYVNDICSRVENPVCVEIGVFGGKSVLPVALELKRHNKGKIHAIDPWDNIEAGKGYEEHKPHYDYWVNIDLEYMYNFFLNLLKEYEIENYVNVIRSTSDAAPDFDEIDFLFIDGQHTEQAVRDALKYATKVKLNGYCVVDDVTWGDVNKVPELLNSLGFFNINNIDANAMVFKRTNIVDFRKEESNIFKINKGMAKRAFVVDNFYSDPMAIRKFAQAQEYVEGGLGRGFIGRRTVQQFLFPGIKETFESIMGKKITAWREHGMNGRFQLNIGGEQLVYHCDSQKYAAMIYLTPNAPPSCGTSTFMHRATRTYHNSDPNINKVFYNIKTTMDGTIYDNVDKFGNIFNRLVIFDAGCIHAASEYFGADMEDGRLWHMFFFDAE